MPISLCIPTEIEDQITGCKARQGLSNSSVIVRSIHKFLARKAQPSSFQVYEEVMRQGAITKSNTKRDAIGKKHVKRSLRATTNWVLMDKMDRHRDLPMDFCAASFVYLATSLKIHRIATIDLRDFTEYRPPGNKRFVHVLDEAQ